MDPGIDIILAELRLRLEAIYGRRLLEMVLFGSQARGDAERGSDIDVLVVLKGAVDPGKEIARTGDIVAQLSLKFNETICCLFMDEDRFTTRNGPLLRNVRKEGIPV